MRPEGSHSGQRSRYQLSDHAAASCDTHSAKCQRKQEGKQAKQTHLTNQGAAASPPGGALAGVPSVPPRHSTLQQEGLPGLGQEVAPGLQAVAQVGLEEKNTGTGASCDSAVPAQVRSRAAASHRVTAERWAMLRRCDGVAQPMAGWRALVCASSAPAAHVQRALFASRGSWMQS